VFGKVFAFELRYHLKSRLFLFSTAIFFLLTYLGVVSPNVQFGALGGANYNSPFAIMQSHIVMAILAVLVGASFLNSAALRDAEFRMAEIVYSTRIDRVSYVLGRFCGAFLVAYVAYLGTTAGFAVASLMPWLDQELIGPFVAAHYAYAAIVVGLPALLANLAIVYALATWTRDQRIAYAGIVGLLVLYQVSSAVLGRFEYRDAAGLVDPSGAAALGNVMRYWTVFERNGDLVPLAGTLLANRAIWTAVALLLLALTTWRFEFNVAPGKRRRKALPAVSGEPTAVASPGEFPRARATHAQGTAWRQLLARTGFELQGVLKSVFFWVLVALAAAMSLGNFFALSAIYGTEVYPVTRSLIQLMSGTATLSLLIILVFYGAELVWRDREIRYQEILGSSPAPNWVFLLSKIAAAILVVVVCLAATALVAVLFQVFNGYMRLEPALYLVGYFYDYGAIFYLAAVLSVVLQVIAPNKYFGMLFMVLYIVALLTLPNAGWEDPLYLYGTTSSTPYSDMNGYDGQLGYAAWYHLYWLCAAVLLGVLAYLLWTRGPQEAFRARFRAMRGNWTGRTAAVAGIAAAGFAASFAWIYYNTHVLNDYVTDDDQRGLAAEYERRHEALSNLPIPRITDIRVEVDLYPERHAFESRGEYRIENRTDAPIDDVPIGFAWNVAVDALDLEGATLTSSDADYNMYRYSLDPPMAPGERRKLSYTVSRHPQGFKHDDNIPALLAGGGVFGNGTFVNSNGLGPYIGFNRGFILTDRSDRWREGLEPVKRYADLDDRSQWRNSYLSSDSDWVSFEAVVTTSADQTAIAPGYLVDEGAEGDRRRFHYRMDAPMQNLYAVLSARYASRVEDWNGIQLSVFYHPAHDWNVDRMLTSLKKSIGYFAENFSPYQYRQMRVLEFPGYASFAQSFPNTVPWSETIGFIADLSDPEEIDYVFYVGAHEIAHQWWGHQVSSANVQGQTVLVETLAQYSALMLMEHEYGPHVMRRFLKYELDNYLQGRGGEAIEELPLYRVENQAYVHYRKGSVVMYAIKDALGEDAVNRALANLVAESAYRYDPYPTSRDLLRHLRAEANTEAQQQLITALFEKITLWDLELKEAAATLRDDGRYDVTLEVIARQYEADGRGEQTEVPLDLPVDIGIFTMSPDKVTEGEDHVLHFEKQRITTGTHTLSFTVNEKPSHAGIDPYNKLIDRNSDDNLKTIDTH